MSSATAQPDIPNYRRVLSENGIRIVVDVGTRDNGGEAHLLLLKNNSEIGFATVHDSYAPGIAPMFCAPYKPALARFEKRIISSIVWGSSNEIYEYLRDEKNTWEPHPMWERSRLVCINFLTDAGEALRELRSVNM